jgi:hypothetical protein
MTNNWAPPSGRAVRYSFSAALQRLPLPSLAQKKANINVSPPNFLHYNLKMKTLEYNQKNNVFLVVNVLEIKKACYICNRYQQ